MKRPNASLLTGLLWTMPWWLGFLLWLAIPLGVSLYISFCDYPLLRPPVFIGADNYRQLAGDQVFHKCVANTVIYAALAVPLSTALAVAIAVLLNRPARGQAFYRAAVFIPTIVPLSAVGLIWMWLLNPEHGAIASFLGAVGIPSPQWLESSRWAMSALLLVSLWLIGSPVVIYLAGLQGIPESLYEAARLDGASNIGQFRHVTLPMLSPIILFNVIVGIINAWQVFALPYMMWRTRQGPERVTYFYTHYLFDNAFNYLRMGYASAMAWLQLLLILALTGLVFWVSRKTVHYASD